MTSPQTFSQSELATLYPLPGISGSPEDRFIQSCILYYHEWLKIHSSTSGFASMPANQVLILIYSESPAVEDIVTLEGLTSPKRIYKKNASLDNGLAVCTENLNSIYQFIPSFTDVDTAMNFIMDKVPEDRCFAVILVAQKRMFIHRAGQNLEEWCNEPYVIPFNHVLTEITPESIEIEVSKFHDEYTKTHRAPLAKVMWNRKKMDFISQPERHIQSGLLIYFRALLKSSTDAVIVDPEVENPGGRMDLRIARLSPKPPLTVNTVIELKVLRPPVSASEHTQWAISGVTQAQGYRDQQTDACLACIFDARKDKTPQLIGLNEKAAELNVKVSMYDMELPPPVNAEPKKRGRKKTQPDETNPKQAGGDTG